MPKLNYLQNKEYKKKVDSWAMYDWANSAFYVVIVTAIFPVYFSKVAGAGLEGNLPTIYWGYATSISMLLCVCLLPILGAIADYSAFKKKFLAVCVSIGTIATALLFFVKSGNWLIGAVIFVIANLAVSCGDTFYNSLLPNVAPKEDMDRVSSKGFALGYLGGALLLFIDIMLIQLLADKELASRLSFLSVAIWWAVFSIPLFRNVDEEHLIEKKTSANLIGAGFKRLFNTVKDIKNHKNLLLFLIAFWFYNDGIGTLYRMAAIYGAEIGISTTALVGTLLMTNFIGMPFTIAYGWMASKIGTKKSIYVGLVIYTLISFYGPFIEHSWQFWLLGFFVGMVQGGTQALSRSLFASLIPKDKSAEFFGFYGVSAKFAGILGPLVFALISGFFGSSRASFISVAIFFIIGLLFLIPVKENK